MKRPMFMMPVLAASLLLGGCALTAPRYTASLPNVQALKDGASQPIKVGAFQSIPGSDNENPISLRGSQLQSPYGNSYANYLAEALKQELTMAGKLAPDAQIEITGALRKNDIHTASMGTATGDLEARFIVMRNGATRYDQIKTIHDEWESSFMAAIAIPRAQEHYPVMVQKLLDALYGDRAFMEAIR